MEKHGFCPKLSEGYIRIQREEVASHLGFLFIQDAVIAEQAKAAHSRMLEVCQKNLGEMLPFSGTAISLTGKPDQPNTLYRGEFALPPALYVVGEITEASGQPAVIALKRTLGDVTLTYEARPADVQPSTYVEIEQYKNKTLDIDYLFNEVLQQNDVTSPINNGE